MVNSAKCEKNCTSYYIILIVNTKKISINRDYILENLKSWVSKVLLKDIYHQIWPIFSKKSLLEIKNIHGL